MNTNSKNNLIIGKIPHDFIKQFCELSGFKLHKKITTYTKEAEEKLILHQKQNENRYPVVLEAICKNDIFSLEVQNKGKKRACELENNHNTCKKRKISTNKFLNKQSEKQKCYSSKIVPKSTPKNRSKIFTSTIKTRSMVQRECLLKEQSNNPNESFQLVNLINMDGNVNKSNVDFSPQVSPVINCDVMIRSQSLYQAADDLGLKCHSVVDKISLTESYHFFFAKKTSTILNLEIMNIDRLLNCREIAIMQYTTKEKGKNVQLKLPFCDFPCFIWTFRGMCMEAFFPTMREQLGLPEIEEPDVEELACQSSDNYFSILEKHSELRLEELAYELQLSLHKGKTKNGANELIFKELNPQTKLQLHFIEKGNTISVTTKILRTKYLKVVNTEQWQKISRAYFRYAVIGKSMQIFYQNKMLKDY